MLISSTIPNLINGVSQQPYIMRLASQCESQDNGYASISEGLKKRPPSRHIAKLFNTQMDNAFIHVIDRDATEKYVVTISNQQLKVHDVAGNAYTVDAPNGYSYLTSSDPVSHFRAVTVADYTFILNTTKVVQKGTLKSATAANSALVYIKQGNYGKTYKITIDGVVKASFTTPNGSTSDHSLQIDTSYIATQLATQLTTNGVQYQQLGSVLHITSTNQFTIAVEDGYNGNATELIKGKAQKFSDLPSNAPLDYVVEVAGDEANTFDSYYVKFTKQKSGDSVGVWQECVAPGVDLELDATTMPHILVRNANGTFTFKKADWGNRLVGDDDSSPFPSFVGNTLTDMFFYRNRLGILSGESAVFSEAGEFFNFFTTTVTTVADTDPIDIAASHTKVSLLKHAVPFNETLLLFSEQTQFKLESGDLLTPKSVSIDQTTEFACTPGVRPIGAGRNVFFCVPRGDFTGVREYYVSKDNDTNDASDVTAHVMRYIPGKAVKMTASTNEDVIALLADGDRTSLYIYKYYWSGDEKLQSAWGRWKFADEDRILSAEFINTALYLVISRPDGTYLERIDVDLGADDDMSTDYRVMLDRKVIITGGVEAEYNLLPYTTITAPYGINTSDYQAYIASGTGEGEIRDIVKINGITYISGQYSGEQILIGRKYKFRHEFSTVSVKEDSKGGGSSSRVSGRLQLRRFSVTYDKTGYFIAHVTPKNRQTYSYRFTGKSTGGVANVLGVASLDTGVFRFPVMAKNTDVSIVIENDTPLPTTLLNVTWEGFFVDHTQRT